MAAIGVDTKLMQSLVPMLMGGSICDRIRSIEWPPSTVEFGIEVGVILSLVIRSWIVKVLALLEERSI